MRWSLMGVIQPWIVGGFVLVAWILSSGLAGLPANAQGDNLSNPAIRGFERLSANEGWIWLGERLYRTSDGCASWQDITPPLSGGLELASIDFRNAEYGWAVLANNATAGDNAWFIAHTSNGGRSWQIEPIPLAEEDRFVPVAQSYLTVWDENTLWVVQKIISSANFSRGFLYRTLDGGKTWQRLELPIAAPIKAEGALKLWLQGGAREDEVYQSSDGGTTWVKITKVMPRPQSYYEEGWEPGMNSEAMDWKLERKGNCEPQTSHQSPDSSGRQELRCRTVERLWSTSDGGRSWAILPLPNGQTSLTREEIVSTNWFASPTASQPLGEDMPESPLIAVMQGHAFDKCEIPSLDKLAVWRQTSPYRAVNLYIGGIHRACDNKALSPEYIVQLRQQGWGLIPTWVGLQARCTTYTYRMSKYPPKAYLEGRNEADLATEAARELGLTNVAGTGSVIYYDLEHYDISNEECNQAARAFINGWVERMNELGMIGGVYSSGGPLSQFADLPNPPPVIWAAHWMDTFYNPQATVWDVYRLSNELWKDRQRLRQYTGGHPETWGEVTLNIDSNVMDGIVSFHLYLPQGFNYHTYFPFIAR
ncbi:MAG: hypothetical protein ANABAC_2976 [Anaerolineae bacterium]|nr:MAG: hypothetical protein ANABAC_2976 [Anaerolineae bacterium]